MISVENIHSLLLKIDKKLGEIDGKLEKYNRLTKFRKPSGKLTVDETAHYINRSRTTVSNYKERGLLVPVLQGTKKLYPIEQVEALFTELNEDK